MIERRWCALILTDSTERLARLDHHLWVYESGSFLPHGSRGNSAYSDALWYPIWLTVVDENPNRANVLILIDQQESNHLDDYELVYDLFDGQDQHALQAARQRWKTYKAQGHTLTYWKQMENENWQKQSSNNTRQRQLKKQ